MKNIVIILLMLLLGCITSHSIKDTSQPQIFNTSSQTVYQYLIQFCNSQGFSFSKIKSEKKTIIAYYTGKPDIYSEIFGHSHNVFIVNFFLEEISDNKTKVTCLIEQQPRGSENMKASDINEGSIEEYYSRIFNRLQQVIHH